MVETYHLFMSSQPPVIAIVGAGLAGLACARMLAKAGHRFTLYEASDGVGGRVRSDKVEGFTLDRGFQVLLPAYPEARRVLDYEGLKLRPFYRGADVFYKGKLHRLADPFHHPLDAIKTLRDPFVPWQDKLRVLHLRKEVYSIKELETGREPQKTEDYLLGLGFSETFIDRFFRPYFGGIFLEKDLRTSAPMMRFIFSMFDKGGAAIPAHGMQAIPDQLAVALPPGSLRLNTPVSSVRPGEFVLENGELVRADHIVLAVTEEAAHRLLPPEMVGEKLLPGRSTTCLYFTTNQALPASPVLYLDGDGRGPVNNACVISRVSPDYAPAGQHLVSASVVGAACGAELESVVREHLSSWFGPGVEQWRHLRTCQVRNAQPESRQLRAGKDSLPPVVAPGLYRCGDYCTDVSINGALISGRRAAEALLASV